MTMDLSGPAGDFSWDVFSWHKLLRMAERYGWQSAGTHLSEDLLQDMPDGVWHGGYTSNDGQSVIASDADQLAGALERALPDIPDADVLAPHRIGQGEIVLAPDGPEIDDVDWFCGVECKNRIREFIRYCRAGEFTIE
jgi:hypothetical protein